MDEQLHQGVFEVRVSLEIFRRRQLAKCTFDSIHVLFQRQLFQLFDEGCS
jgi:hypothetical protein